MMSIKSALCFFIVAMLFICSSCGNNEKVNPSSSSSRPGSTPIIEEMNETAETDTTALNSKCIGWGVGKTEKGIRPSSAVLYNQKYKELGGRFIGEDNKKVYLTFDEGYENGYTSVILDTLKEKGVSAVFFVTYDYVKKNHDLVLRMINEGHIVGNHSWSHPSMPSCTQEEAKNEIMRLHNLVLEKFNYKMTLFRFPRGEFSERTLAVAKNCGYKSVFWSFAYVDWKTDSQPEPAAALCKTVDGAHNGEIYLLHAVYKTNSEILSDFIDGVTKDGYTFSKYDL